MPFTRQGTTQWSRSAESTIIFSGMCTKHIGIIQSLLTTCRLHNVGPCTHLVDVLQRVGLHPAKDVEELTPSVWKERFADNPLRSDLEHAQ